VTGWHEKKRKYGAGVCPGGAAGLLWVGKTETGPEHKKKGYRAEGFLSIGRPASRARSGIRGGVGQVEGWGGENAVTRGKGGAEGESLYARLGWSADRAGGRGFLGRNRKRSTLLIGSLVTLHEGGGAVLG